ncbi:MAG: helix-turn-helix domain-containing protein [Bacillaceae bacterium]
MVNISSIGHLIKFERMKQNIKQASLTRGICSTSYLSKIENNHAEASEEVIGLLLKRLNIKRPTINREKDEGIQRKLTQIYKEVTIEKNVELTKEYSEYLQLFKNEIDNFSLFIDLNLTMLRLNLALNDSEQISLYMNFLNQEVEKFSDLQRYFYKKYIGIHFYQNNEIVNALQALLEAVELSKKFLCEDWERADLYYMVGLVFLADNQLLNSIQYITKALDYFKDNFYSNRLIDCYVLLGIAYKRTSRYRDSLDTFLIAQKIMKDLNLDTQKGLILQNLGSLYSKKGNLNKSIGYYLESLEYKLEPRNQLITIFSIIQEYGKYEQYKEMSRWIQEGLDIIEAEGLERNRVYYHHFNLYKSIYVKDNVGEMLVRQAIDFFESIQDYRHCNKYCIAFAENLFQDGKYKLASFYYQRATKYYYIMTNSKSWEDL